MTGMSSDGFTTKRIRLAGHTRVIHAPGGDPFMAAFGRGRRYRGYARFCRAALRPGDSVVDVGANIGVTSLIAGERIGPAGRLLAVEASPLNARALTRTLAANGFSDAQVETCGVGAVSGTMPFHEASAFGFVMEHGNLLAAHGTLDIPIRTLDEIVGSAGLESVDLIKIDIEGYEWEALRGAVTTILRHDPLVFLEFNSWCQIVFYDRNPRAFLDYLIGTFPQLYLWQNGFLASVREIGTVAFLRRHLLETGCISDLVVAVGSERLERMAQELAPRPKGSLGWLSHIWTDRFG